MTLPFTIRDNKPQPRSGNIPQRFPRECSLDKRVECSANLARVFVQQCLHECFYEFFKPARVLPSIEEAARGFFATSLAASLSASFRAPEWSANRACRVPLIINRLPNAVVLLIASRGNVFSESEVNVDSLKIFVLKLLLLNS